MNLIDNLADTLSAAIPDSFATGRPRPDKHVKVITDSVSSIPAAWAEKLDLTILSMMVIEGDTANLDVDLDPETYYDHVATLSELPTTSQPAVNEFEDQFRMYAKAGRPVLGVFVSEKMSGTMQAAHMAANTIRGEFPQARIELLDTNANSLQEGMVALAAATKAMEGASIEECIEAGEEVIRRTRFLFIPQTLENLRKGGRIGKASGLLGDLIKLRPVLTVEDGETDTVTKVRTDKKALATIIEEVKKDIEAYGLKQVYVHYIGARRVAEEFQKNYVEPLFGKVVEIVPVSAVVGIHVGPTLAAIVYECERPVR